jgi:hypothetical protein
MFSTFTLFWKKNSKNQPKGSANITKSAEKWEAKV